MALRKRPYLIFLAGLLGLSALAWWYVRYGGSARHAQGDIEKKKIVYQMYADYKRDFPEVKDITPKKAMALLRDDKVVFVDTRSPAEMRVSMLPKAVTEETFMRNPQKYSEKTVVAYCTISYRSGKFAEAAAKRGIRVYNLEGGLLAWVLEGGKVYDTHGETRRIHVYGKRWNYPAQGYESVW